MLNALRLNAGFSINNFEKRTGLSYELVKNALESSRESGMLRQTKNKFWIPTSLGFRFLNDLQAVFLPS
jgi:coproporphyrinogen III oxidase-like Fe-S oxidoreductase